MTDRSQPKITSNTPLRLADAVKIAFPMGGMTVAGLRRERDRDRLVIEKIAGKEQSETSLSGRNPNRFSH